MQLDSVVLAMQKIKARVAFPAMECAGRLSARSDGSFKREEETGYGKRCCTILRNGMKLGTREVIYHLLDGVARSHKHM